jgi:hypothetical protein
MSTLPSSTDSPKDLAALYTKACGLILVALAVAAGLMAHGLPVVHRGTIGPGAFPLLLAFALAVSGVVLCLRKPDACSHRTAPSAGWKILAVLPLFPLLLTELGTVVALSACGIGVARITSGSWVKALLIGCSIAAGLHLLFMLGLGVPLPWGGA